MSMDREQLADFLRTRREALQPEDVGLPRGPRRRTGGLRREEVAVLCGMSADYVGRLEQRRGPQPSEQMLAAIARGLRLTHAERDHLFRLAGHHAPAAEGRGDLVSPALLRVLDRLQDTPAQVITSTAEVLAQTPGAIAVFGDANEREGLDRSTIYRWFTDPGSREVYPSEDHPQRARDFVADLRAAVGVSGRASRAARIADELLQRSPEFGALWAAHEVRSKHSTDKRIRHPELGVIAVQCQVLHDLDRAQMLLVFTATPGTADADKLALLSVIGRQRMSARAGDS